MQWCDEQGLAGHDRSDLLYLIRSMDREYLAHSAKETKAPAKEGEIKAIGGGKIGG